MTSGEVLDCLIFEIDGADTFGVFRFEIVQHPVQTGAYIQLLFTGRHRLHLTGQGFERLVLDRAATIAVDYGVAKKTIEPRNR